jgi:predicted MFS family arabinose efflux permease
MAARFVDRVGKGIRVAPRDALLTELAPGEQRGAAFGLRKAMDSLGATLGPLLALLLMAALDDDIRLIYWLAVIPAVLCVAVLALGVREPSRAPPPDAAPSEPPSGAAAPTGGQSEIRRLGALGPRLLGFVGLTGLLQFALFSEAFMLLRAAELGLRPALVPALLIVMNLAYAIVAYVSGLFADRGARSGGGRAWLLYPGFLFLILAYGLLIAAHEPWHCFTAAVAWGVHLGMTQGVMPTIVADLAPAERRGTAFGAYHLALGVTALPAGAIAGVLWQAHGADATFLFGSGLTVFALAAFALWNLRFGKL